MSRWPPEIAGTISHPAGRSAVTAERVPIFYSARSSSPSSSSSTRRRILPFSLSLTLSLLLSTPPPPPMHRGLSVLGRYNVSTRMDRSRFPPQKEGRKGWQKMAGSTKESRCPDNPDLSTLPPILSFFFSFLLLLPHTLSPPSSPPSGYFRTGSEWVGCVWVVATLLAEKRGGPFELTRDLLYLYARIRIRETFRSKTSLNNDFPFRHVSKVPCAFNICIYLAA